MPAADSGRTSSEARVWYVSKTLKPEVQLNHHNVIVKESTNPSPQHFVFKLPDYGHFQIPA
jgi:hypothetical protein